MSLHSVRLSILSVCAFRYSVKILVSPCYLFSCLDCLSECLEKLSILTVCFLWSSRLLSRLSTGCLDSLANWLGAVVATARSWYCESETFRLSKFSVIFYKNYPGILIFGKVLRVFQRIFGAFNSLRPGIPPTNPYLPDLCSSHHIYIIMSESLSLHGLLCMSLT